MELPQLGTEMSREQEMISTKKRLETFQFRRASGPSVSAPLSPTSSVGRPHSRQTSVSSVSFSASNSNNSALSASEHSTFSSSDSRPSSLVIRSRPNSHHRRRSSVSTRVESAEMMGISLPDLPMSSSDDNINFGDKDSVRRRALQALEGRNELVLRNNTVEIPDFASQGITQKPFDREVKLSSNISGFGLNPVSGKRDSFGKYLSSASSIKDQLHTLMEEEEEEEECSEPARLPTENTPVVSSGPKEQSTSAQDHGDVSPQGSQPSTGDAISGRHRPATLTLRPLSLVPNASGPSLPTPSLTPNMRPGLRSLSLAPPFDTHTINANDGSYSSMKHTAGPHSSNSSSSSTTSVHFSSSSSSYSASGNSPGPKRQSSISYIRSGSSQSQPTAFTLASLPTPGATPTSERRQSSSSVSSFGSINGQDRRNASEDMFLQQSYASLLTRIAELERALQSRSRSRPSSTHSDSSADTSEAPHDEMLQLVSDLKAERDELNKDIEGWRQRVKDLEHAQAILGHEKTVLECRLEAEKRESWLKREKLGLLEMEKMALSRQVDMKQEEVAGVSRRLETTQAQLRQALMECSSLKEDAQVAKRQLAEAQHLLEARKETELELHRVREALAMERTYRERLVSQLDVAGMLETPRVGDKATIRTALPSSNTEARSNGLGFLSVDSSCTTVDLDEESRQALRAPFTLKAVDEEAEPHAAGKDDEGDELARYEDEDDLDVHFSSPTHSTSSNDSIYDSPRSLSHFRLAANSTPVQVNHDASSSRSLASTPSPTSSPCPTPIPPLISESKSSDHASRSSLSKTWTFPRGGRPTSPRFSPVEVDRFFGCLEDIDTSPPVDARVQMDDRNIFSQRLKFVSTDDDDLPPFVLPSQKAMDGTNTGVLDVVLEEDEDNAQRDTPARESDASYPAAVSEDTLSRVTTPLFDGQTQTKSVPFIFPQMKQQYVSPKVSARSPIGPNSEERTKSTATVMGRNSAPTPPRVTTSRTSPATRIPPPSPPMFIQAKGAASHATPSPPKRKSAPSPSSRGNVISPPRAKLERIALGSPQNQKRPGQSTHGSTFIPQLRTTTQNLRNRY